VRARVAVLAIWLAVRSARALLSLVERVDVAPEALVSARRRPPVTRTRTHVPLPVIRCAGCLAARQYAKDAGHTTLGCAGKLLVQSGYRADLAAARVRSDHGAFEGSFWDGVRAHIARAGGAS